jgi:hypothetical protein
MKKIKFVKDYSGQIVNCRNEEKAQEMIDRGYAVEVE